MVLFPKKDVVGLDIGSSSIKALELQQTKRGYRLKNAGVAYLPPGSIVEGAIKDAQAVSSTIRNLVANLKIKNKNVATSISGHSVIIKNVSMPVMSETELEDSIRWEAEQYIPFEIDDVNIDFQILGENPEDKDKMDVLLVAAKQDMINDYTTVISDAGLNTIVMDIASFALMNMFEVNYPYEEDKAIALVDIGASVLNMNVLKNGVSVFTRDVSIGGNKITEEIQKAGDVSYEEAEAFKIGDQSDDTEYEGVDGIMEEVFLSLAIEIQRSLDFFWATFAEENISKICLSGGCSKNPKFRSIIGSRVSGIPVELVDPFGNIDCIGKNFDPEYLEYIAPLMAVSVGLALRQVGDR